MPLLHADETSRRSVVPPAAGRSPWLAAVWTGAGTAVLGAVAAIATVAILWLPASHGTGNATSAIKAGLLSFLAALHGGITVDSTDAAFLPLGMTLLLGVVAWRAGRGLADAVDELQERDRLRLLLIGATQTASFTAACLLLTPLATLGTSSAPVTGVGFSAVVLFTLTGGLGYARGTELGDELLDRCPDWLRSGTRVALLALAVLAAAGAALVACSLFVHRGRAETLLQQVGPGWNGAPVLLLCILAAPNAVIAAASYLTGPGFAVGAGTAVGVGTSTHGVLPSFPLLAALPSGEGPGWLVGAVVVVPLLAGLLAGSVAFRAGSWHERLRDAGVGAAVAGLAAAVLAWQGGGGIGDGRLATVGASPWRFGGAVLLEVAAGAALYLGARALLTRQRPIATPVLWVRHGDADEQPTEKLRVVPEEKKGRRLAG